MEDKKKIEEIIKKYEEHAEREGIALNPDRKRVENIARALLKKEEKFGEKYCPCRVTTGNKEKDKETICPCIFHKDEVNEKGHCICWLFVKK